MKVVRDFHLTWYDSGIQTRQRYRGIPILKHPCDLFVLQEVIFDTRPDVILEMGTWEGGSAYWYADQLRTLHEYDKGGNHSFGYGVLTIDIDDRPIRYQPERTALATLFPHNHISYMRGADSTDANTWQQVKNWLGVARYLRGCAPYFDRSIHELRNLQDLWHEHPDKVGDEWCTYWPPRDELGLDRPQLRIMVVLDSCHDKWHVLKEMEMYGDFVTPGCYMVVEDTNLHGHPVAREGEGPMEAVEDFFLPFSRTSQWEIDKDREYQLMTKNPCGYLRKR